MELLMERWAPILGYEGRYEVSDYGRVRSLPRWRRGKAGSLVPVPGRVMRLATKKRNPSGRTLPYVEIRLRDGGLRTDPSRSYLVHRLVAQAFVGELFEGCHVDHIDGDHGNNHWANLRILSPLEHGRLHPCVVDAARLAAMQASAQARLRALRTEGKLVGRHRVETTP